MARKQIFTFDKGDVRMRKDRFSILKFLWTGIKIILASMSLFIVLYAIVAVVISTDTERRLRRENRMYEKTLPQLRPKAHLLGDVITGLQKKDSDIYGEVFHTDAPSIDPMSSLDIFFGADSIPDDKVVAYARRKIKALTPVVEDVENCFNEIYPNLATAKSLPPMAMPVKDISYTQIGASVGRKINPLIKAEVYHRGLDIIVPQGTPVYATGDGTVVKVSNSFKGEGKFVALEHEGGYVTRYLHLSDIKVREGQKLKKGQQLGFSGMSGNAFAPHLHYEVLLNGELRNPIQYFFADVDHDEYSNMLFMSINTRQSMD